MTADIYDRMSRGASLSKCRSYRYSLYRRWNWHDAARQVIFIGLNPSTADELEDDPTIRRCVGFAHRWGFDGLIMLNVFALRSTDPRVLRSAHYPIGPQNNHTLTTICRDAPLVVAAWGTHCPAKIADDLCKLLNREISCLGKTKSGAPKHPLYLRADTELETFWSPAVSSK